MASSKLDPLIPPSSEDYTSIAQNYAVLPPFFNRRRRKKICFYSLLFLAVAAAVFALWPSDPHVKIARLRLLHVRVHTHPRIAVDISLAAKVRVQNRNFYSMDYTCVDVAVGYRGKALGHVTSGGGHVTGRGSSYVDAMVDVYGTDLISDWIYLLDDLAKGLIRFDTLTQVDGSIGLFLFKVPLKAKISCEIDVNIKNQTATHQNCYPSELLQ